jgi:hypothetical protein
MHNSVLNSFLAAFAGPRATPMPTPELEAARDELLQEVSARLEETGQRLRVECGHFELRFAPSDVLEAGQDIADTLEERDWPLLWLEQKPWGYGFAARAGMTALAIGGVFLDDPRNIVWLCICDVRATNA